MGIDIYCMDSMAAAGMVTVTEDLTVVTIGAHFETSSGDGVVELALYSGGPGGPEVPLACAEEVDVPPDTFVVEVPIDPIELQPGTYWVVIVGEQAALASADIDGEYTAWLNVQPEEDPNGMPVCDSCELVIEQADVEPDRAPNVWLKGEGGEEMCLVPVDCEVTDWTEWTECTATCDGGTQSHTREITQIPWNGGKECPALEGEQACNIEPCCGNGDLDEGEECDEGGVATELCNPDCTLSVCGDTILNEPAGEECDDGNNADDDGCSATCESEFGCMNGTNVIDNGGFETGELPPWLNYYFGVASVDDDVVYEGEYSLECSGGGGPFMMGCYVTQPIANVSMEGVDEAFLWYYLPEGPQQQDTVRVYLYYTDNSSETKNVDVIGTGEWQKFDFLSIVKQGKTLKEIRLRQYGYYYMGNKMYFDDIAICKQDKCAEGEGHCLECANDEDCAVCEEGYEVDDGKCVIPDTIVFVTSEPIVGAEIGGIEGADEFCQQIADTSDKTPGQYAAWISTADSWVADRMKHSDGKYVRVDGVTVADDWTDLTNNNIDNPLKIDEQGNDADGNFVWTATHNADGGHQGPDCEQWTSTGFGRAGKTGQTDTGWTNATNRDCSLGARLYCFQVHD